MDESIRKAALDYHRLSPPGKIAIAPTKGLVNQRDLALAYTPGVAAACEEIVRNPAEAATLTAFLQYQRHTLRWKRSWQIFTAVHTRWCFQPVTPPISVF